MNNPGIKNPANFTERLRQSVVAVPPLARNNELRICREENRRMIEHLRSGGVRTYLYGGNALFYHVLPSEYAEIVDLLLELVGPEEFLIPSIGPTFGMMMDQASILADRSLDTAMVLPQKDITDPQGIERGIRLAVERLKRPVVLYLKFDRWLPPDAVERLVNDGYVSWIKYAVVLEDPSNDPYLKELLQRVPPELFVSGMGEQPAICHLRDFGFSGFTSGCVCIRPDLSTKLLHAATRKEWDRADAIRSKFEPLENLRNAISPIRVLHESVRGSGIADVGPLLPLMSHLNQEERNIIDRATKDLLQSE